MKNIKKFISKNLAVFLSLAIIVTTLLPVMSGVVGAAEYDAAAISELKNAWAALSDVNVEFVPESLNDSYSIIGTGLTVYNSSSYTGGDIDVANLGSKYGVFNANDSSASNWDDYLVFKNVNENSSFNIKNFKDYTLYIKATNVTTPEEKGIVARPRMKLSNGQELWRNNCHHTAAKVGENVWNQIKASDMASQGELWTEFKFSNELSTDAPVNAFGFDFTGVGNVTVGTLIVKFSAVDADTLALAGSDTAAFVDAAKAFRAEAVANGYYDANDTAFAAFKTALNNVLGDSGKLDELKSAWKALTYAGYDDAVAMNYIAGANTGANYATTDAPQAAPASKNNRKVTLGTNFTLMHYNEFTASSFFANGKITDIPIDKITDMYFYYKATGDVATWFHAIGNNGSARKDANFDTTIDASKVILPATNGEWVKVSFMDYLASLNLSWSSIVSSRLTGSTQLASMGFQAKTLSGSADIYMSELFITDGVDENLAGSDGWTDIEWVMNAVALDLSEYSNAPDSAEMIAFNEALKNLPDEYKKVVNADKIKKAWAELSDITREFVPAEVWDGTLNNGVAPKGTGLEIFDSSAYAGGDLTETNVLGSKYATYTVKTNDASDWKDYIVFESVGDDKSLNVKNLKGYAFYIKSSATTLARPRLFLTNKQQLWNNASIHSQAAIGSGEWKLVKSADMDEQSKLWTTDAGGKLSTTAPIAAICLDFSELNGASTDITVGTVKATFSAVTDDVLALASTDVDAFMEAASNFYFEAVTNGYYAEEDDAFAAFVEAAKAAGIKFSLDKLIGGVATAWQSLTVTETLVPVTLWLGQNIPVEGLNVYDSSAYTGTDLADKSVLGPKYATFIAPSASKEDGNEGNASDWADYVVFAREDGGLTKLPAANFTDFTVYIKTADGMGARPRIHAQNGYNWNDPSYYAAEKLGNTWKNISSSQLSAPGEFNQKVYAFGDQKLYGFGIDFSGTGEVSVGSMTVNFTAVNSKTLALLETDPVSFLAEAIYFYNDAVKNGTFAADDARFVALGNAINEIVSNESLELEVATAELKAAWMALSDNTTLPKGDTTDWSIADWVYAANRVDINSLANTDGFVKALAKATALRDEIGATFTCNTNSYANYDEAEGDIAALGDNALSKATATAYYFDGTDKNELTLAALDNLYDGDFSTEYAISDLDFTAEGSYVELIYAFNGAIDAKDFVVGFGGNSTLASTNYRIYVANSIEKLFATDSIVASFNNENGDQIQKFNFDGKPQISGTYVAFRFYGIGTNDLVLSELAAYGDIVTYNVVTGAFTTEQMQSIGDSLLDNSGVVTYVKSGTGPMTKWEQAGLRYQKTEITDLDKSTAVGISVASSFISNVGDEISYYIIFDLKKAYNLEKILLNHHDGKYLATGKYEIYASTERALLTRSESKIISYNNMSDGPNGTSITQLFSAAGKAAVGRFVALHIIVPVCDYASLTAYRNDLSYPRISDIGVFGTEYVKPLAEINFLNHTPVEVYRTDAGGNKTSVKEEEYSGDDYKLAYDGDYTVAAHIAQNDKNIDFLFNLCANKAINSIKLSTLTENIKGLKVYASETVEGVWDEENCVVNYAGEATNVVSKTFGETPVYARYVRFSITDTESGIFDPTEFEVIGWNTQEFVYMNLMQENAGNVSLWLEDKSDYSLVSTFESANEYLTAWNAEPIYGLINAFDGEEGTVADLYGGSLGDKDGKGRTTINMLLDLGNLMAIDEIEFIAGSSKDYWPSELKFYAGEDDISLFGKDAEPLMVFDEKSDAENGSYSYNFLPKTAQYVRVEFVESTQQYYAKSNMILAIIAEMKVNGLEVVGSTAAEGAAASVTDKETGIRADVVALRDNDVLTTVQDITVVSRPATADEKRALAEQSAVFASDIYDVYLLDANDNIITDIGGREVKIYLPKSLFKGNGDAYVLSSQYGEYVMVDFTTVDEYYVITVDDPFGMSVAFCEFADIEIEEDVSDMDNDLTDDEDEGEDDEFIEEDEDDDDDDKPKKKKKVKVIRKNNGDDFDYIWLIICGIAVVVIAAGIVLFLILKKKKNNEEE